VEGKRKVVECVGDGDGRGTEVVEWVRAIEFLKGWEGGRE
jgi:hypothetical protein